MTERLDEQMERQMNGEREGRKDRREMGREKERWMETKTHKDIPSTPLASLPTSFSWALSLVVWKLWLSSSTSFKSERSSRPAYRSHQLLQNGPHRNSCTLSAQLLSAWLSHHRWWEIARNWRVMARLDSELAGARPGWTVPRRHSTAMPAQAELTQCVPVPALTRMENHQKRISPWELEDSPSPRQITSALGLNTFSLVIWIDNA